MALRDYIIAAMVAIALGGALFGPRLAVTNNNPVLHVEVLKSASCSNLDGVEDKCSIVLHNKAVLFFSTQCPSCMELLSKIEFSPQLVGVSSNSLPFLRHSSVTHPIRIPVYQIAKSQLEEFGLHKVPTLILLNQNGEIAGQSSEVQSILETLYRLEKESM